MTATAEIVVERVQEAVLVPNRALRFEPPNIEEQPSRQPANILSAILPRRRGTRGDRQSAQKSGGDRVWTLKDGHLVPVPLTIGVSDGRMSQVVDGDLRPGTEVVVDVTSGGKR
jgi:HlyD family secretion protein